MMSICLFTEVTFMIKRLLDIIFSFLCLVCFSPLFILVGLIIFIIDGYPIFFMQERIGKDKKTFKIIKFRTMRQRAELELDSLQIFNEENWPFFKISADPRITKLGKILRKLSIDELPQLINILKGDMSFVGPRPVLQTEAAALPDLRFSVRPGLTGPTQIYRNEKLSLAQREQLEKEYVNNKSFFKDVKNILQTFLVIFKGK